MSVSGGNVTASVNPLAATGGVAHVRGCRHHHNAGVDTLTFSTTLGGVISTNATVTISAGAATLLSWATQPSGAVYGSTFSTPGVLQTTDRYGNPSTLGLSSTLQVGIALSPAGRRATLIGTTSYNIGSSGSNGVVSLNDLGVVNGSGSRYKLTASASAGTLPVAGSTVWIDAANASTLQLNSTNGVIGWTNQGFASGVFDLPERRSHPQWQHHRPIRQPELYLPAHPDQ